MINAPSLSLLLSLTVPTLPCGAVERPVWKEFSTSWSWSTYSLLLCSGVSLLSVCLHVCEILSCHHTLVPQSWSNVCEPHVQFHKWANTKSFNQNVQHVILFCAVWSKWNDRKGLNHIVVTVVFYRSYFIFHFFKWDLPVFSKNMFVCQSQLQPSFHLSVSA